MNKTTKASSSMHIFKWVTEDEVDFMAETEPEEVKLAQSLLDEARISSAYARLAVLIDAVASHYPGPPDSMRGSNKSMSSGDPLIFR